MQDLRGDAMSAAEALISRHLQEQNFYLNSLTREQKRHGPYTMEIQTVRYLKRISASLALANLRIEEQSQETSRMLGLLDARTAALAREGVLR